MDHYSLLSYYMYHCHFWHSVSQVCSDSIWVLNCFCVCQYSWRSEKGVQQNTNTLFLPWDAGLVICRLRTLSCRLAEWVILACLGDSGEGQVVMVVVVMFGPFWHLLVDWVNHVLGISAFLNRWVMGSVVVYEKTEISVYYVFHNEKILKQKEENIKQLS